MLKLPIGPYTLHRVAGLFVLVIVFAAIVVVLSACSLLPSDINRKAASVAEQSCQRLSLAEREILRDSINYQFQVSASEKPVNSDGTRPDAIIWCGVRCPGDAPPNVQGCATAAR
jgi:hypothetical protein